MPDDGSKFEVVRGAPTVSTTLDGYMMASLYASGTAQPIYNSMLPFLMLVGAASSIDLDEDDEE